MYSSNMCPFMVKIPLQVEFLSRLVIGLLVFTGAPSARADSQAMNRESSLALPEVNATYEIKLENLFRENVFNNDAGKSTQASQFTDLNRRIQLVGTLIMAQTKFAWIKTGESEIHVLTENQHVPGSALKISRIFADSVELVNTEKCRKHSECIADLELDLN